MNLIKEAVAHAVDIETFFWQPKNPRFSTYVHISQPTPLEERNLGQLFILCEITNQNKENKDIIATLVEELESRYYGTNEVDQNKALEIALHETNKKIAQIANELNSSFLTDLSIAAGVCYNSKISFAEAGQIHAYLIHQEKIIDILEKNRTHEITNPLRTFSNMLSGKVEHEDAFIVCTSSLLDYLSLEKLKRLVKEQKSAAQTVNELKKLLINDTTRETIFAAMIFKTSPAQNMSLNPISGQNLQYRTRHPAYDRQIDSMEKLIQQEERTTELLTPSLWPNLKKVLQNMKENITQKKDEKKSDDQREDETIEDKSKKDAVEVKEAPLKIKRKLLIKQNALTVLLYLKMISGKILGLSANLWHSIIHSKKQNALTATIKNLPYKTNKRISTGILNLKNLTRQRKFILSGAVILIIIFSWSISHFGTKKELQKNLSQYEAQIKAASDKQLAAESNIIFHNEEEARKLLVEAQNLLASIPGNMTEIQNQLNETKTKIEKTSREINKIVDIPDPKVIADLGQIDPNLNPQWMILEHNEFYTFSANTIITKTKLTSSETKQLETKDTNTSPVVNAKSVGNGNSLLFHEDQSVSLFSTESESFKTITFNKSPDNLTLKDSEVFNQRVYILDPEANQIFKYNPTKESYDLGGPWITDSAVNIKEARAFAIDANIYILQSDGNVLKLFSGARADFEIEKIEPNVSSATDIMTNENLNNIYIVDPNNKRIVIFDKQGKLVSQKTSEKFDNLKNILIDEPSKKIYVLNGQKIYNIDM